MGSTDSVSGPRSWPVGAQGGDLLTINKSDIVQDLAQKGFRDPDAVVDRILTFISSALWAGEVVTIRNFGKFEPRERSAVVRRNPKSGELVDVPAKTSIGFRAAPALKQKVNS